MTTAALDNDTKPRSQTGKAVSQYELACFMENMKLSFLAPSYFIAWQHSASAMMVEKRARLTGPAAQTARLLTPGRQ